MRRCTSDGHEASIPRPEDENRVELNEDFNSRYQYSLVGEEVRDGYDCWIVQLVPRSGDLPVRRRIDTALNKSTGRLWVVKEDFGVSRVEFEMDEPVRLWGGIVGVLRNTVGHQEFTRTTEGAWLQETIDIRLDLRVVFWNHEAAHRPAVDGVHTPYPRDRPVGQAGGRGSARVPTGDDATTALDLRL